jgi:hypothetical protein
MTYGFISYLETNAAAFFFANSADIFVSIRGGLSDTAETRVKEHPMKIYTATAIGTAAEGPESPAAAELRS